MTLIFWEGRRAGGVKAAEREQAGQASDIPSLIAAPDRLALEVSLSFSAPSLAAATPGRLPWWKLRPVPFKVFV